MKIRRCQTHDDLVYATSIHHLLFDANSLVPHYYEFGAWLVWHGDGVVGFAMLGRSEHDWDAVFVSYIGLLQSGRGRGLGRRLVRTCVREARRLGHERVISYTWTDNIASAKSFLREGFELYRPAGAHPEYLWFEKKLEVKHG